METILEATPRDTIGKNEARRTRRQGKVPAVLYGGDGRQATPIAVDPRELLRILHSDAGQNTLISLRLAGAGDTRAPGEGFSARPDYAQRAARRLLSRGDGQAAAGDDPGDGQGRTERRQAAGRRARI